MRTRTLVWIGCGLLIASAASGALTPEQTREAQKLLRDFTAAEFATRQAAVERLVAMGPDVIPLVWKTLAETNDAEVKLRCEMVMKGLQEKHGIEAAPGRPPRPFGLGPSRVTIDVKDAPLQQALDLLAKQSGNAAYDAGDFGERRVTLAAKDAGYWQTFDALCAQAGLFPADLGARDLKALPSGGVTEVAAYAGPVALKLARVTARRGLHEPLEIVFIFRLACEEGVRPYGLRAEFRRAVDELGVERWQERDWPSTPRYSPDGIVTGGTSVRIEKLDPKAPRIARLEGVVRISAGTGRKVFRFENVFEAKDAAASAAMDGTTLAVTFAKREGQNVRIGLRRTVDGKEVPLPIAAWSGTYSPVLVDPNGKRYTGFVTAGDENRYVEPEHTLLRQASFLSIPATAGAWALVVTLPEKVEEAEFPFAFENLPLP